MLVLLSPAKTLDFSPADTQYTTQPRALDKTERLTQVLKGFSAGDLKNLMSISDKLAAENEERFQNFDQPENIAKSKPALLAFKGDVYRGLEAWELDPEELAYAQDTVRVLSGLYGVLRPLDLIQPYRLEMGTKLKTDRGNDLYEFWGNDLTEILRRDIEQSGARYVLNAASKEYMGSIDSEALDVPVLEADFRELRDGKLKFITYNAKVARGKLAQLVVKHRITAPEQLQDLDVNGYSYDASRSTDTTVAFTKPE